MAILRSKDIRNMDESALDERLEDLNTELARERGRIAVGGFPENEGRIREIRRTIARIKTIRSEMQRNDE